MNPLFGEGREIGPFYAILREFKFDAIFVLCNKSYTVYKSFFSSIFTHQFIGLLLLNSTKNNQIQKNIYKINSTQYNSNQRDATDLEMKK